MGLGGGDGGAVGGRGGGGREWGELFGVSMRRDHWLEGSKVTPVRGTPRMGPTATVQDWNHIPGRFKVSHLVFTSNLTEVIWVRLLPGELRTRRGVAWTGGRGT